MSETNPQPATPQRDSALRAAAKTAKTPNTSSERPKLRMQELNPVFGAGCLLAAIGMYVTTAYFASAALVFVGISFLLYGRDLRPWEEIPRWKRVTVTTLIFIGGACLIGYIISLGGF